MNLRARTAQRGGSPRVLIVEDSALVAPKLAALLTPHGVTTLLVPREAALAAIESYRGTLLCVMLNISPSEPDSTQLLHTIAREYPDLRFMLITSHPSPYGDDPIPEPTPRA